MKTSRSEFLQIRNLRYHVRHWGDNDAPMLFMLHGWMDVSASFQFLVDALQRNRHVIAPDWRGFGLTENAPSDYWQPDYLADLEAILDRYASGQAVNLLGHSLGANVAGIYAGVRPQRIAKLVLLEGFGRPAMAAEEAPQRYATWLDELRSVPLLRPYRSQEAVAARLQKNNPRLTKERAMFLAAHWASPNESGNWTLRADARHKLTNPVLYRIEEVLACWRAITAPVLWVEAEHSELLPRFGTPDEIRTELGRRIAQLANATILKVPDAGHMVQHDQPEILARAIDTFLA